MNHFAVKANTFKLRDNKVWPEEEGGVLLL